MYITLITASVVTVLSLSREDCFADIVLMVNVGECNDSRNFGSVKSFLKQLASVLDIDIDYIRVGLVIYSTNVGTVINLTDHSTVLSLQSAISLLNYSAGTGSSTNTAAALAYVRTTMLTSAAGDRINVPNSVVVVTDGQSDNFNATVVSMIILLNVVSH